MPTQTGNQKFGKINILSGSSLTETIFSITKDLNGDSLKKEQAVCLLSGLVLYTGNFKNNITAEVFQAASELIKKGADLKEITSNIKLS